MEISLLSQIIRFQVNAPFGDFLTMITNFFGSLKSKERWFFRNNKLSLKILWFQALWKPCFESKRNFWINCVCTEAFCIMAYYHREIRIHCIPKRAFTFIASLKGHSHHSMHQWDIRIMAHHQRDIRITAYSKGSIYIMAYPHKHLHHDVPTRSICIMICPLEGICTIRHFASPSLKGDICITGKYVRWHHHG